MENLENEKVELRVTLEFIKITAQNLHVYPYVVFLDIRYKAWTDYIQHKFTKKDSQLQQSYNISLQAKLIQHQALIYFLRYFPWTKTRGTFFSSFMFIVRLKTYVFCSNSKSFFSNKTFVSSKNKQQEDTFYKMLSLKN